MLNLQMLYGARDSVIAPFRAQMGDQQLSALIVTGSGFHVDWEGQSDLVLAIPFAQIPHLAIENMTEGHRARLVLCRRNGVFFLVAEGRVHYYDVGDPTPPVINVYLAYLLGARTVLLTNAAGGIRSNLEPGSLMLIEDHLPNELGNANPLPGRPADGSMGPKFPDMTRVYPAELRERMQQIAAGFGIELRAGVYTWAGTAPAYETPVQVRAYRTLGGDAVGMSTVNEAMFAAALGMEVVGLSLISNWAAGMTDQPLSHDEVIQAGRAACDQTQRLINGFVGAVTTSS